MALWIGVEERSDDSVAWLAQTTRFSSEMYGEPNRLGVAGWFTPDGTGVKVLTHLEGTRFPADGSPLTDDASSSKNSITSQIRWIRSSVRLVGKIEAGDETRRDDLFDDGKQLCIIGV